LRSENGTGQGGSKILVIFHRLAANHFNEMEVVNRADVCEHPAAMPAGPAKAQFENLLQQHAGIIRRVAFGYARTESDRRDLMQEIALQLSRAYPRYSPDRALSTWMCRIALNVAISFLRKNTRPWRRTVRFNEAEHDLAEESSMSPDTGEKIDMLHELFQNAGRSIARCWCFISTIAATAKSPVSLASPKQM
jgi:RNA polymerase sigma factor (sigma-70 family)